MLTRTVYLFIPKPVLDVRAFLPLVALFLLLAPAIRLHAQATDLHDAASQLTKKLHDDPDVAKITGEHIVIAPFENINGKGDAVPRILQEMLTTSFIKAKHFKVLERDQLQSALDELHFQLSDLADPAKAKKVGKLAGAAYVLLGSISDTGGTTTINARIVSIESGESVSAEDIDIKTGDATSAVGGLNPSSNPVTTMPPDTPQPSVAVKPETPVIDLNANANSVSAGQWVGQKSNFGLLGGAKFQIAWRENLGSKGVDSFASGDLKGNGNNHLFLVENGKDGKDEVAVLRWENARFKELWYDQRRGIPGGASGKDIVVVSSPKEPALVVDVMARVVWKWDGTTFKVTSNNSSGQMTDVLAGSDFKVVAMESYFDSPRDSWFGTAGLATVDRDTGTLVDVSPFNVPLGATGIFPSENCWVTAGDYNGDGKVEIAVASVTSMSGVLKPIQIFSQEGNRIGTTEGSYGSRVTSWQPAHYAHPFIVTRRTSINEDSKPSAGYLFFIRWSGENYEEFWKSIRLDKQILDFHVCDPKNEGKEGLVVLSTDGKNSYLTKIVAN